MLHEGILYLSLKHNAGKPPDESVNREYWQKIIADKPNPPPESGRRIIDGGYASTESSDKYEETKLSNEIDGGGASERVHVPLI